jgi:hypothetical protein
MRTLLTLGALSLAACGGGAQSTPAPSAPTSASAPAPEKPAEDQTAKRKAALEALTRGEADKGACDPKHKAALEALLADVEAGMKAKTGDDGKPLGMETVDKRVVALGNAAMRVELKVSGSDTELHVLAMAVHEVSLDVLQGGVAATTLRSPHQRSATTKPVKLDLPDAGAVSELESDSRQVQIEPGKPLEVKLSGEGCAILASFQRKKSK